MLDASALFSKLESLPTLTHPALLSLRLRALFGVGARADIIGSVLSRRSGDFGAADLVFIGYSKRNLAEALDMLAAAGLFRATRAGNRVRFSWRRLEELSDLLSPVPEVIPVWSTRLRVVSGFLDLLTRAQSKSDRLVTVEAVRCLRQFAHDLQALGVDAPDLTAMSREALADWLISTSAPHWLAQPFSSYRPRDAPREARRPCPGVACGLRARPLPAPAASRGRGASEHSSRFDNLQRF